LRSLKQNVDAVYAASPAPTVFRFLRQYKEYGLKLPVLAA